MIVLQCAHCGADNTLNIPTTFPGGRLKWECAPCGGVNESEFERGPEAVDEEVITPADVANLHDVISVADVDAGGGQDTV